MLSALVIHLQIRRNFLTPWLLMQAITATDTFFMFHLRLLSVMPYRGVKSSSLVLEEEAVLHHLLVFRCSRTVQSRRKRLLQVKTENVNPQYHPAKINSLSQSVVDLQLENVKANSLPETLD